MRSLKIIPDGTGFACGTIDGRVSVEYFDDLDLSHKYAFKAHRIPVESESIMLGYPVTDIAFLPP
jgi:cell cycle arrest protein BUB3